MNLGGAGHLIKDNGTAESKNLAQECKLHHLYLDENFESSEAPLNQLPLTKFAKNKSPTIGDQIKRPAGNSPNGDKIVIKKSEIKFSVSPSNSPQPGFASILNLGSGKTSPNIGNLMKSGGLSLANKKVEEGYYMKTTAKVTTEAQTPKNIKQDEEIKQITNDVSQLASVAKGISPKKDQQSATLKLSLSGGLSPYSMGQSSNKPRTQKSQINFVQEMKKHGIDKDIASVKSSRQILQNNSPQSISPAMMMPILQEAIKQQESRDQIAKERTFCF